MDRPKQALFTAINVTKLSPSNEELAEQLEVRALLDELYSPTTPVERKAVIREKINETILESYFDAASVQAEAEREQNKLEALRQTLTSQRDRRVEINNAANFIASGTLNTLGSSLGFSNRLPAFPGNFYQMLSGVVSTTMSMYALKQNAGGKTSGQGSPTVLAELFGRPTDEATTYPESVWRFFHGRAPQDPTKSRIEHLEEIWIRRNELEPHGSRREKLKLDLVCGMKDSKKSMSIDDLSDEINMLSDVSALSLLMSHHLRDLLRTIDSDVVK
ncbi:MAG: hypothetical protein P4L53_02005 [Candidatus Obscuribacterales bacterium]|nr:hypothetical protein [Candidatus Obscuribacterales bacterium]